MNFPAILAVAAGGGIGAVGRYATVTLVARLAGSVAFPWGVLLANVLGACALGMLVELFATRLSASPNVQAFLVVGVLGGFTTFSSFALDVVLLAQRGEWLAAFGYASGSVLASCAALLVGMYLVHLVS